MAGISSVHTLMAGMDRGKRKMTAEEYEQDRIARRRVSGPATGEGLRRLGPVTPVQRQTGGVRVRQQDTPRIESGAGGEGFHLQTPNSNAGPSVIRMIDPNVPEDGGNQDGVEEDHLQTPTIVPNALEDGGSRVTSTTNICLDIGVEPTLTRGQIAQRLRRQRERDVSSQQEGDVNNHNVELSRGFEPILTRAQISQRLRRQRERVEHSHGDGELRDLNTPILNTPSQSFHRGPASATPVTSSLLNSQQFSPINPTRLFSTPTTPLQGQSSSSRLLRNTPMRYTNATASPIASSSNTESSPHQQNTQTLPGLENDNYESMLIPDVNFIRPTGVRHSLGDMDIECPFCKALHWVDERLSNTSQTRPRFGMCCLQGKIKLPPLRKLPPQLQELFDGDDARSVSLRKYFREYNSAFAFTSLGVILDDRIFDGQGLRPFVIHGELRHRTGSLIPGEGRPAMYSQLYVYDPAEALSIRTHRNPNLRQDVLKIIQEVMLQYNRFSRDFRHAYEVLSSAENEGQLNIHASLHYSSKRDKRRYNLPTVDEVAIIIPGDGSEETCDRDIRLHLRGDNGGFVQINECHPAYLPLHYVLMFPYGELGWTPELRRWDLRRGMSIEKERLTQLDFYSYLIFMRRGEYSPIWKCKKLTQQFWVDAWAATEQNKLRWVENDQEKVRCELYQDIIEVDPECVTPEQLGKRVILPSSHHRQGQVQIKLLLY